MARTEINGTLIFENPSEYLAHNNDGFWGPVSSTVDWCEHNYVILPFVAEFWNTISNLVILVFGLLGLRTCLRNGLERRFLGVFAGICIVAIGSLCFHGTLTWIGQQGDETPMIYTVLLWGHCLFTMRPSFEERHPKWCLASAVVAAVAAAVWTPLHVVFRFVLVFQALFVVGMLLCVVMFIVEVRQCYAEDPIVRGPTARRFLLTFVAVLLIAGMVWIIDQQLCNELHESPTTNPQFHAWWHGLAGLGVYCGSVFLLWRRQILLDVPVTLRWVLFVYPSLSWSAGKSLPKGAESPRGGLARSGVEAAGRREAEAAVAVDEVRLIVSSGNEGKADGSDGHEVGSNASPTVSNCPYE